MKRTLVILILCLSGVVSFSQPLLVNGYRHATTPTLSATPLYVKTGQTGESGTWTNIGTTEEVIYQPSTSSSTAWLDKQYISGTTPFNDGDAFEFWIKYTGAESQGTIIGFTSDVSSVGNFFSGSISFGLLFFGGEVKRVEGATDVSLGSAVIGNYYRIIYKRIGFGASRFLDTSTDGVTWTTLYTASAIAPSMKIMIQSFASTKAFDLRSKGLSNF